MPTHWYACKSIHHRMGTRVETLKEIHAANLKFITCFFFFRAVFSCPSTVLGRGPEGSPTQARKEFCLKLLPKRSEVMCSRWTTKFRTLLCSLSFAEWSGLSWVCLTTHDRISATECDTVSKRVLQSCFGSVWKKPRNKKSKKNQEREKKERQPKLCDPIFHHLSFLLSWERIGERILRSCLHKGVATV